MPMEASPIILTVSSSTWRSARQRPATFTSYTIDDHNVESNVATVTITVNGANDAPVAAAHDGGTTTEDAIPTGSGLLDGATDVDTGAVLTIVPKTGTSTSGAAVTINADGTYTYNPTGSATLQALVDGGSRADTFTYQVKDQAGATGTGTVTVTVTGLNDAPVAVNNPYTVGENATLTVAAAGGLTNDTDVDTPHTLTAQLVDGPAKGLLTFNANGGFTYNPNGEFE